MYKKLYASLACWIIDLEADAPTSYTVDEIQAFSEYSQRSVEFVDAVLASFKRTQHIQIEDNNITRLPDTEWVRECETQYYDFT